MEEGHANLYDLLGVSKTADEKEVSLFAKARQLLFII